MNNLNNCIILLSRWDISSSEFFCIEYHSPAIIPHSITRCYTLNPSPGSNEDCDLSRTKSQNHLHFDACACSAFHMHASLRLNSHPLFHSFIKKYDFYIKPTIYCMSVYGWLFSVMPIMAPPIFWHFFGDVTHLITCWALWRHVWMT